MADDTTNENDENLRRWVSLVTQGKPGKPGKPVTVWSGTASADPARHVSLPADTESPAVPNPLDPGDPNALASYILRVYGPKWLEGADVAMAAIKLLRAQAEEIEDLVDVRQGLQVQVDELEIDRADLQGTVAKQAQKLERRFPFWLIFDGPPVAQGPGPRYVGVQDFNGPTGSGGSWTELTNGHWALGPFGSSPAATFPAGTE